MKCEECGALGPENKCSAAAQDWDWFTGYFERTVHFCPEHKESRMRYEMFEKSREKPRTVGSLEGYR